MTGPLPLDVFGVPLGGVRLIEASAGTGKTWAICALYLRLLLERRLAVQQILVVTFTNAATAELRTRLRGRLVDVLASLQAGPGPEPVPEPAGDPFVPQLLAHLRAAGAEDADLAQRLSAALQNFDDAAVFTIHGFCQRALADTAFAAQQPLVQTLLADDSALLAEAVNDVWRRRVVACRDDPALVAHLLAEGDSPARWALLLKRHLAKPLARLLWPAGIDVAADRTALADTLAQAFDAARLAWPAQRSAVLALLKASLTQLHGTYYKAATLQAAADAWDSLLAQPAPPAIAMPSVLALVGSSMLALRTKAGKPTPTHPFFDTAQALLDAQHAAGRALRLARLRLLRDMLAQAAAQQRASKRAQRLLAFDDMLFNLHQRLHQNPHDPAAPALAGSLRQRWPAALIDEFQDTDPLQWAVFQAVYAAPQAGPAADRASAPLFLVGDPKQAIYSFRHADLHTYLQARSAAAAVYSLAQNQRASAALISALNRLFGQHGRPFMLAGLDHQPVALGSKPRPLFIDNSQPGAPPAAALQVWTLPRQRGAPLMKADATARSAAACASEIARLLAAGRGGSITLGAAPLAAGDMAVLVRSHAQAALMRQALAVLGVASVAVSQASVFDSDDAAELARVLAAMLQPGHDGLVKAALASRWLGLAADQIESLAADALAWLAQVQQFAQLGVLWRSRGIGVALQQWRQQAQVAQRLLAHGDGQRRLTNLLHLAELLQGASAGVASPEALLQWLLAQRGAGGAAEATQLRLESDQHLVQIVTIHKSKGLEYPLVFCPFLWHGRSGSGSDGLDGIAGHDDSGAAVVDFRAGFDDSADAGAAKAQAKLDAAGETLRLVYVALTRAVHRCWLVAGSFRSHAGKHVGHGESARSLLNWLVLGAGLQPADWFNPKRPLATPAEIDAAWARLADGASAEPANPADPADPADDSNAAGPAIAVGVLPAASARPLPPHGGDGAALHALAAPPHLPGGWWIGSFSSLAQGADAALADSSGTLADDTGLQPRASADHDAQADVDADADADADAGADAGADTSADAIAAATPMPPPADDVLRFPRGTLAGEAVHAAFEFADFSNAASWPVAIGQALARLGPQPGHRPAALHAMLHTMLAQVLAVPLPLGTATPLRLASLGPGQRLNELEFHLHAPRLQASALSQVMARHGLPATRLAFGVLQGYLKGFIDLVFQHQGRWFIADWKSNHLGDTAADYGAQPLAAAMTAHQYHLQSLLYSVALQRWLQLRLPGYRHADHFGGALYLFVRGLRPGWLQADGRPAGLHLQRASAALLDQVSALLDGAQA